MGGPKQRDHESHSEVTIRLISWVCAELPALSRQVWGSLTCYGEGAPKARAPKGRLQQRQAYSARFPPIDCIRREHVE